MGTGVALAGGEAMEGALHVKVMTDEQMEVLRKQISVYAAICEQLVDLHRTVSAHQDSLAGMRLGNLYCDSVIASAGHKLTARQRWTPTPVQLQILESIFDQGNGTPSKQKIKEITTELSSHGQISEANVYNWFQNRRARSKRKQTVASGNNIQLEEIESDSPKEKKCKPGSVQSILNPTKEVIDIDAFFQGHDRCSDMLRSDDPEPTDVGGSSRDSGSLGHISFYGAVVSDPTVDRLMGNMVVSGAYNSFHCADDYDGMID